MRYISIALILSLSGCATVSSLNLKINKFIDLACTKKDQAIALAIASGDTRLARVIDAACNSPTAYVSIPVNSAPAKLAR